jgi:hypothetical protein
VNRKSKQEVLAGLGAAPRELPDVPHAGLPVDHAERDRILATAMQHLSRHNIAYVPLDVEEDIEISYQRDDLDRFRETVRGWMRQLGGTRDRPPRASREDPTMEREDRAQRAVASPMLEKS